MRELSEVFHALQTTASFDWWDDCNPLASYEDAHEAAVAQYEVDGNEREVWSVVLGPESRTCRVVEGEYGIPAVCVLQP